MTTCKFCEATNKRNRKRALAKHHARKEEMRALLNAKASGKVTQIYFKDELTGIHFPARISENVTLETPGPEVA